MAMMPTIESVFRDLQECGRALDHDLDHRDREAFALHMRRRTTLLRKLERLFDAAVIR